jgi:ABC-type multidrug transport system ATPase subunit
LNEAIRVSGLCKGFGGPPVLDGLDLSVAEGDFLVVFGANGAGKTTLLKLLATLARPDAGRIAIHGLDSREQAQSVRALIGYVGHQTLLYGELTVRENLLFYGRMYGVPALAGRIEEVARRLGVHDRLEQRVDRLSHGLQKRAAIARALLHNPSVLLADEPESGLDLEALASLGQTLACEGEARRTVVMTTHNLEHGLDMGNRVAVLAGGRIAYQERSADADVALLRRIYHAPAEAAR